VATLTSSPPLECDVRPEDVGLSSDRLARLDRYLDNYVAEGRQKGSLIAISRGGQLAHVSMRGHRDAEAGLPVETDTLWRIYSMSKPITSVAAMMLYEEGALSLFDPVAKFIPAFEHARVYKRGPAAAMESVPASHPMQVWHLLTHTAGLTYDFFFNNPVDEMYRKVFNYGQSPTPTYTLAEACERWASIPLLFEPGTSWNYSVATDVLGRVVEVASGQTLDAFFKQRIFEPLGMRETSFSISAADQQRLAVLYGANPQSGELFTSPQLDRDRTQPAVFLSGGGGLISTASDYLRFTKMLLQRGELDGARVLAPPTVDLMRVNHLPGGGLIGPPFGRGAMGDPTDAGRGFGLGFGVVVDPVAAKSLATAGEYSWAGAAGTQFWVDPDNEITVVFCTQVLFARDELGYTLRRLVNQALID
jgi:CubicO group peptidase (beta-lactamase class C family)